MEICNLYTANFPLTPTKTTLCAYDLILTFHFFIKLFSNGICNNVIIRDLILHIYISQTRRKSFENLFQTWLTV
uniref:Putative ovule protein n=1 Tax=Solanum chacoense TaxID=4108 RepID=A0A0V0GQP8_SOLCH